MDASQIRVKLKNFRDTLPEVRDRVIVDAIFSAVALIKRRLNSVRLSHTATSFGTYSSSYLKKRIKKLNDSNPNINFSFTNKMMRSTLPQIVSTSDDQVVISVEPRDPQRNEVMGYHDTRFKAPIILPSDEEIDLIVELFVDGIKNHFDNSINE